MQKKLLLALALTFLVFSSVHAASPSPLASPSPASINEVTDNLKARLKQTQDTALSDPNRAYVGTVKDVIKDTIVMQDKDGKRDIKITSDTAIVRTPGNTPIKPDSIRIDDSIIAIGVPTETDVMNGKRLIVSTTPFVAPSKSTAMGTIKKITKSTIAVTVGDNDRNLDLSSTTTLKSIAGTIALSDLAIGDTVIYTALNDNDGSLSTTIVMRIKTTSL